MKNIAVFTFLVIIICAFTANNSAFCQDSEKEKNYSFSIGAQFGLVYGQSIEIVYPFDTMGELLSELRWDMKSVFFYGLKLDFSRTDIMSAPGFFASASFKVGIPGDSGIMEDRDWMSKENSDLTHFSSHTNRTREFFWLDIVLGETIPLEQYFYVMPFLSGSWMHFAFTARDGYGIYPWGKELFKGDVITYKQDWFLIAVGFSVGTKILSPFLFGFSFQMSPFNYCIAKDEHLGEDKRIDYYDFTGFGIFLEPAGVFSFSTERIDFSLEFAYRYIGRTKGESYLKPSNVEYYSYGGKAGAGLSLFSANFFIRVRI